MDDGKSSPERPGLQLADSPAPDTPASAGGAEPTDDALIQSTLAGDAAAFGQLVVRYQDRLHNSLYRFTGSADDASDIAQEAFVQAFTRLDRFRNDAAFFTWLYRIAMNRAISVSRKRREKVSLDGLRDRSPAREAGSGASGGGGLDPTCDAPPDARSLTNERVEMVHRALNTLAEEHRQVLVLREFDGLDYQEIAAVVSVPVGTVRSRLFRARSQLKDALAEYERE